MKEQLIKMIANEKNTIIAVEKELNLLMDYFQQNEEGFFFSFKNRDLKTLDLVSKQIHGLYSIINKIKEYDKKICTPYLQEYFYKVSETILHPTLKFGYAYEAEEILKIMRNSNLVGRFYDREILPELKQVIQIYGRRYAEERVTCKIKREDLKDAAWALISGVITGEYGSFSLISKDFKENAERFSVILKTEFQKGEKQATHSCYAKTKI